MKKTLLITFILLLVSAFILAACGGGAATQAASGGGGAAAKPTPPPDYAGKTNPHAGDSASATAGKQTFDSNCASCHGQGGKGDGPAAAGLEPKPANLAGEQASLKDDYIFWRISEGGKVPPFSSAMPAWKGKLSDDQIWQLVTYIHTLTP